MQRQGVNSDRYMQVGILQWYSFPPIPSRRISFSHSGSFGRFVIRLCSLLTSFLWKPALPHGAVSRVPPHSLWHIFTGWGVFRGMGKRISRDGAYFMAWGVFHGMVSKRKKNFAFPTHTFTHSPSNSMAVQRRHQPPLAPACPFLQIDSSTLRSRRLHDKISTSPVFLFQHTTKSDPHRGHFHTSIR